MQPPVRKTVLVHANKPFSLSAPKYATVFMLQLSYHKKSKFDFELKYNTFFFFLFVLNVEKEIN